MKITDLKQPHIRKEVIGVLCALLIAAGCSAIGLYLASEKDGGVGAFGIGFLGGFVPIFIEFIIAVKNKTLLITDEVKIAEKYARNKKLARLALSPAIALGLVQAYFPGNTQILMFGVFSGYLLPYTVFLLIHFFKNYDFIMSIAKKMHANDLTKSK